MIRSILARSIAAVNKPNYHNVIERLIVVAAEPVKLFGPFDIEVSGAIGVRRLNQVLHYISIIPKLIPELGCKPLDEQQQLIADLFVRTSLPSIVTPVQLMAHRATYMKMLNVTKLCTRGGVLAPRQSGKSWTVAICCAAAMMACPGVAIGVFATQFNQAQVIQGYVVTIFDAMRKTIKRNKMEHRIWVPNAEHSQQSSMTCFGLNAYVYIYIYVYGQQLYQCNACYVVLSYIYRVGTKSFLRV